MRYGLTRMVLGESGFVLIDREMFCKIDDAKRLLKEILYIEQKFDFVVGNLIDFESDLLILAARNMLTDITESRSLFIEKNNAARRVVNMLSACRLYTDHAKHHLSSISSIIPISDDVNRYFSEEYEKSFSYRFMEALRNHVQHRGFPFHSFVYDSSWTSLDENGQLVYSVEPIIQSRILKEDGKFKSSVLDELEDMGGEIDLRDILRKYIEGIGNIHSRIRKLLKREIQLSESIIDQAIAKFQHEHPGPDSTIGLSAVIEGEDEIVTEEVSLDRGFIELLQFYQRRNASMTKLSKRVVSNAVRQKPKRRKRVHIVR